MMTNNYTKFIVIASATIAVSSVIALLEAGKSKKKIVAKFLLMSKPFVNISTISSHLQ
jgi:hypothetical protein